MNSEWDTLIDKVQSLQEQGSYESAVIVAIEALQLAEHTVGHNHLDVATSMLTLAFLYDTLGQYVQAEPLYKRSLAIREKVLGSDHPDVAYNLSGLALLYRNQGQYAQAVPLCKRSLAILENALGSDHPHVATSLNNLAALYCSQGQYAQAEPLFKRTLAINENALGPDHPDGATSLNNLEVLYYSQGQYAQAEPLSKRTLAINENALGPDHPDVASSLSGHAVLCAKQGLYAQAEHLEKRSLAIREKSLGSEHPSVASSLNNLASLYDSQGKYVQAEPLYKRALAIWENVLGSDHDLAKCLNNLAVMYENLGQYAQAEQLYKRSLAIKENLLRPDHPDLAWSLGCLAGLYVSWGQYAQAEQLYKRSLAIWENVLRPDHPDLAWSLSGLARLYNAQGLYSQAEHLYKHSLAIREKRLGSEHPTVGLSLNELAIQYHLQGQYLQAEPLYKRSIGICEKVFDPDHPDVAKCLNNLAGLYADTGRLNAAILLKKRSINIFQKLRQNISGIGKGTLSSYDKTIEFLYDNLSGYLIKAGRYGEAEYVMGMLKEKEQFGLLRRDRLIDLPTRTISYNDAEAPLVERFDEICSNLFTLGKQEQALGESNELAPEKNPGLDAIKEQLKKVNQEFSEFLDNLHEALPEREVTQIDQDSYKLINMTDADAKTVAIFTVTAEDNFHTVMVTPHDRKAFSAEYKAVDIATKVLKFRELLKDPDDTAYLELSKELYDIIIIRKMEEELLAGEYTTILWMLNGVLRLLPLAALHDGKQFVLEKFRNVCITTCSAIGQQSHDQWNGLGMGVTQEYEGHDALENVKVELEGIISSMGSSTGVMPGDILLDEAFTRDAMKSHLKEGYKAVHIASHFELNPANETMSYLLLGDGTKIRMDELRSMPKLFEGVDLVAFSACSTGLGTASTRGREVDGIGYLGEMQGANTVMATLWPVEDKSTSMLMREFYRLREAGMTTAEALRQAQLCLLNGKITSEEGHDFTHPYFWAPFILIGNGG